jgi:hypothetical protein
MDRAKTKEELWIVVEYEIQMFYELFHLQLKCEGPSIGILNNAITESKLLHIRNLVEVFNFSNGHSDDIRITGLIENWKEVPHLEDAIRDLRAGYGRQNEENSPHWIINKMLAHPTSNRGGDYNYRAVFDKMPLC